jgi:enoyl-CoA hydratase
MTEPTVLVERRDTIALVTLNRPASRNAVNIDLALALVDAIEAAQDAHCIVITGTDPAFCAGLDLRDLGTESLAEFPVFPDVVAASSVPTIAAVNGAAVTGGLELALACDFIVASERARFADTHVRVGVYPGPVLVELPRRIGMAKARELSMTGNFVDADTAARIGLVNHVVSHDGLLPLAFELAGAIAEHDPAMIAAMRRDWDETSALPAQEAHRRHRQIREQSGFAGASADTLRTHMRSAVERSHQQAERRMIDGVS